MEHFFLNLFQTHFDVFKHFGYIIIFFTALIESIPLLGMLIPGQSIIILAGFLVKLHMFGFWLAVIISAVGATCGDLIGFMMGRKYGKHFTTAEKRFYIKRDQFVKTRDLISTHPFKSIFFGRLHSLTRTLTPFAGGASDISIKKFLTIDLVSSFAWAFISILIGFIFGKSFEKASSFIGSFILIATIVTVGIIIVLNYAKKKKVPISNTDVFIFISSTISIYLFSLIAQNLHRGQLFGILDSRIYILRNEIITPTLTFIMTSFTALGNPISMVSIFLLFFIYLFIKKQKELAILSGIIFSTGYLFVDLFKAYFSRIRPHGLIEITGSSFPSGHATMSIIFATLITYTTLRHIKNSLHKNILITLVYAISIFIGLSRVYLGVHWASDVLAGFLFGIFYATFGIVLWKSVKFIIKITKRKHELPLP